MSDKKLGLHIELIKNYVWVELYIGDKFIGTIKVSENFPYNSFKASFKLDESVRIERKFLLDKTLNKERLK